MELSYPKNTFRDRACISSRVTLLLHGHSTARSTDQPESGVQAGTGCHEEGQQRPKSIWTMQNPPLSPKSCICGSTGYGWFPPQPQEIWISAVQKRARGVGWTEIFAVFHVPYQPCLSRFPSPSSMALAHIILSAVQPPSETRPAETIQLKQPRKGRHKLLNPLKHRPPAEKASTKPQIGSSECLEHVSVSPPFSQAVGYISALITALAQCITLSFWFSANYIEPLAISTCLTKAEIFKCIEGLQSAMEAWFCSGN